MSAPVPGMHALDAVGTMDGEAGSQHKRGIDQNQQGERRMRRRPGETRLHPGKQQHARDQHQGEARQQQRPERGFRIQSLRQGDGRHKQDDDQAGGSEPRQRRPLAENGHRRAVDQRERDIANLVDDVAARLALQRLRRPGEGLERQQQQEQAEAGEKGRDRVRAGLRRTRVDDAVPAACLVRRDRHAVPLASPGRRSGRPRLCGAKLKTL